MLKDSPMKEKELVMIIAAFGVSWFFLGIAVGLFLVRFLNLDVVLYSSLFIIVFGLISIPAMIVLIVKQTKTRNNGKKDEP